VNQGKWTVDNLRWDCSLEDVSVTPSGTVWAVGWERMGTTDYRSIIIRQDGQRWHSVPHPDEGSIGAILMLSDESGWAAGSGAFLHWDGVAWRRAATPRVEYPIYAIDGVAEDDLWAVGGVSRRASPFNGAVQYILHYDGEEWSIERERVSADDGLLTNVTMVTDSDGWAVGENWRIYRFDGIEWNLFQDFGGLGSFDFLAGIAVLDRENVWFSGNGIGMVNYEDGAWKVWGESRWSDSARGLTSVSMLPGGTGWAVGPGGYPLTRVDGEWHEVRDVPYGKRLAAVVATDPSDVWASAWVGGETAAILVHYNGSTWTEVTAPSPYWVTAFASAGSENVWAIASTRSQPKDRAGADILHYDGQRWSVQHSLRGMELRDIDMVSPNEGWAVGGALFHFVAGAWRQLPLPPDAPSQGLVGVALQSQSLGWAVGNQTVLRYAAGRWSVEPFEIPLSQDGLRAVAVAEDGTAWIAGRFTNWYYRDGSWHGVEMPDANERPYAREAVDILAGGQSREVWTVGQYETITRTTIGISGYSGTPTPFPTLSPTPHQLLIPYAAHMSKDA
jgi:hypothetical protein